MSAPISPPNGDLRDEVSPVAPSSTSTSPLSPVVEMSPTAAAASSPAPHVLEITASPIPQGANYHTGAVDGNMASLLRTESSPNLRSHPTHHIAGTAHHTPLFPKRFNDDITDHSSLSPLVLSNRSTSNPQTPKVAPDGQTGNAPNIPPLPPTASSHSSTSLRHVSSVGSMHDHLHIPSLCNHKARFDHTRADDDEEPERDPHTVPFQRPIYERDEQGVFHLVGANEDAALLLKQKSKLALASLAQPNGVGAGPRAPPVALASAGGLARATSNETGFHPHGRVRLPYNRIGIEYATFQPSAETTEIAIHVRKCLELRAKFVWTPLRDETEYNIFDTPTYTPPTADDATKLDKPADLHYAFHEGVFTSWRGGPDVDDAEQLFAAPNRKEFGLAMGTVMDLVGSGPARTFCHNRLHILEARFNLHDLLNHDIEQLVQKSVPHRDFYNVRKIDNHVHHSAAMNQKHLLRFIKAKLKKASDEIVIIRDGKELTLPQVFQTLNITPYDLSVDTLDMHADKTFHRFDKFNLKYNPVGESRLREVFLKYNNHLKGKYLAEITQQVFEDLESNKYQFAEYRLSIYGAKKDEWYALSDWVVDHNLFSSNVRWMIQIPRLYSIYKANGQIKNFAEMLDNIFRPLFAVTVDPASSPKLHAFLESCVGFDMVDDESLRERPFNDSLPPPNEWDFEYDPPYALFAYYLYANICALNKLRTFRGMTSFAFRPHSGEAGDIEHLAASFLLAKSINHGLMLQKSPALQYLYYLAQIGISMSPLSNNLLFLEYEKNPFPKFFKKGLNVTLSTDDPLMIHVTREPLVEEYSVAAQVWKLSAIDMCEICRNSVLQSGFEQNFKSHFIGNGYWRRSLEGNDIRQTNVPDIRIQFRAELLGDEFRTLQKHAQLPFTDALIDRII